MVRDDAFPLKKNLLKPCSLTNLTKTQNIFNYKRSRAHRTVENGFGIWAGKFRIFKKPIPTYVNTTDIIIRSSSGLHKWLNFTSFSHYFPRGCFDEEEQLLKGLGEEKT